MQPDAYITGYRQLSLLRVGFYPVHSDKSPAVQGKLNRVATLDPIKIEFWAEHCHHRSFAARFLRGCRLLVIDTENPFKCPDRPGPDGEMFLGSVLEDFDVTLPQCPMVRTASGGFHRYFMVPKGLPIRPRVSLWPGIDILAAGSSVILPGSRTTAGEYHEVRSFEECSIPEAPRPFIKLIRKAQTSQRHAHEPYSTPAGLPADLDTAVVSRRQWCLLFRNRVFRSFWNRQGKAGDSTDSAYEYHLAKACLCCGLNLRQVESVILNWRRKHGLERDFRQLRYGIIPRAWAAVQPWVENWRAEREASERARKAAKTANAILAHMNMVGIPQAPASIAKALSMPRERAKKAMKRLAERGKLERTLGGYQIASLVGTF